MGRNGVRLSAQAWLGEGGVREDDGLRFLNHFHNPLHAWQEAGLRTVVQHPSSIEWMQDRHQFPGGRWAWQDARRFYYDALTAPDARAREAAAADLFRTLGHIMHLVVDASVPEHTRDDPHVFGTISRELLNRRRAGNYEYWVSDQHTRRNRSETAAAEAQFAHRYLNPVGVDADVFSMPIPPGETARIPIARLIDSDRYTASSPDPELTLSGPIGLAEFANANFFSENTLRGEFPFPRREALIPNPRVAPRNSRVRAYFAKPPGEGLPTAVALAECASERSIGRWIVGRPGPDPCVDEAVWEETASHMLPRAVGYARAVLDYFFRGSLSIVNVGFPADGLFIRFRNTSNERMDGVFEVYARYEKGTSSERRHQVVLLNGGRPVGLDPGEAVTLPLAIPAGNPTAYHLLVFRGRLGAEEEAVVGRVFAVPHVEIVQESYQADLIKSCILQATSTRNAVSESFGETLRCRWAPVNHRINGRIETNFSSADPADPTDHAIARIAAFWSGGGAPAPLSLDGVTYPSGVWIRGEDDTDPRTFSILDPARRGNRSLFLEINLRDPEQDEFVMRFATFAETENIQKKMASRLASQPFDVVADRTWRVDLPAPNFRAVTIAGLPLGSERSEREFWEVTLSSARRLITDVSERFDTRAVAAARLAAIELSPEKLEAPPALEWRALVEPYPEPHPGMVQFWQAFVGHGSPATYRVAMSAR